MFEFLLNRHVQSELATIITELSESVIRISELVKSASTQKKGTYNAFGEEQAELDVLAQNQLEFCLESCEFVGAYCSEELDAIKFTKHTKAVHSVYFDPLDGSSLLDTNFSVGTIIGIYDRQNVIGASPRDQVAAIVAVYGPRTTMLITTGDGVLEFTLNGNVWHLSQDSFTLNSDSKYFAPGNLRAVKDNPKYGELVNHFIQNQYTLRYSGGMVPDVNHILKKGAGVFMYPASAQHPNGKLRLLYECAPIAFLIEQAGGTSVDQNGQNILDIVIESWSQTTPIFTGQKKEVEFCREFLS